MLFIYILYYIFIKYFVEFFEYLIKQNNIGNLDWGSLIGGIAGGAATLIAFLVSNKHNKKQHEFLKKKYEERDTKEIRPFFKIIPEQLITLDDINLYKNTNRNIYTVNGQSKNYQKYDFLLKNIGVGHAINIIIKAYPDDNYRNKSISISSFKDSIDLYEIGQGSNIDLYDESNITLAHGMNYYFYIYFSDIKDNRYVQIFKLLIRIQGSGIYFSILETKVPEIL